jgi:uncharacterized protein (DUF433 family)
MTELHWSTCDDVESVPDRCGGAWVAKGSRVMVEGILENAEDASPEEVADMFELPVEQVRRILAFAASAAPAHPETRYMNPICEGCKQYADERLWYDDEEDAACSFEDGCTKKPVAYIRADLFDRKMDEIVQRGVEAEDELYSRILTLQSEIDRLKAEIDTPRERRGFS